MKDLREFGAEQKRPCPIQSGRTPAGPTKRTCRCIDLNVILLLSEHQHPSWSIVPIENRHTEEYYLIANFESFQLIGLSELACLLTL